jgi:hypothetical protein
MAEKHKKIQPLSGRPQPQPEQLLGRPHEPGVGGMEPVAAEADKVPADPLPVAEGPTLVEPLPVADRDLLALPAEDAEPDPEPLSVKMQRVIETLPADVQAAFMAGGAINPRFPGSVEDKATAAAAQPAAQAEAQPGEVFRDPSGREIKPYRYCPVCWAGNRGYGTVRSTSQTKSYLKCQNALTERGSCGFSWSVQFIEETVVIHSKRPLPPGETR